MVNSKDKPSSSSAQLSGFAAAAGSGAGSRQVLELPTSPAAASASSVAVAAAAAGGGAGTESIKAKNPAAAATALQGKRTKKRGPKKGGAAATASAASSENNDAGLAEETVLRPLSDVSSAAFEPTSLPQIQLRLKAVLDKLPKDLPEVPPKHDPRNNDTNDARLLYAPIKSFAATLQIVIEEYNLLLSLVSSATYKWGVDRSGASQQNLSVMSAELQQCQEVISSVVSARLSNVLCPAVEPLIGEVEIVREGGTNGEEDAASATPAKKRKLNEDRLSTTRTNNNERRINHFIRPLVDPSYVHLCHCILARNGPLIRHTVATSIHTAQTVIGDYLNAMKKDSSHEAGKGGYY